MNSIVYSTDPKIDALINPVNSNRHIYKLRGVRNFATQSEAAEAMKKKMHAEAVSEYRRNLCRKATAVGLTLAQYCSRFNINIMKDVSAC